MANSHSQRRSALFELLPEEVSAMFLSPGKTLRYFTGLNIHKSERPMLVALHQNKPPAIILPALEVERIQNALEMDAEFFVYQDARDPVSEAKNSFNNYKSEYGTKEPIAVEYRSTRLLEYEVISDIGGPSQIVDAEQAVSTLRSQKDETEVAKLRYAAEIIDEVLSQVTTEISPGMTEQDVATTIHKYVLDTDADGLGSLIVAGGSNSAKPHTNTGTRKLERGDPLIIDAGVIYKGYYSDITRTYQIGQESERLQEIHDVTREAARAAREAIQPGKEIQEIDRTAREIISNAGFGENFPHRVGHGLGLEVHEQPYLVDGNDSPLQSGHTVTIEPGIYIEGFGGVRVEDDVVVTDDGADVLTSSPRELRVI
ncbi:M24 family metallopeptidase [Halopenitus persicus]|uniref:Xaa-Pro dipeptidase n=1 Tax=Halopenitus persicus TaxID=1048396 RepID=A0A1H3P017_9EURY|nr:Xaa-Pro peptidase family protein [Halopenitus persicus]SDY94474.1 Xaa-Pro dipeptidase [Halopenitus persicus]